MTDSSPRRDWGGRRWSDYGQFYRDIYGSAIIEEHRVGRVGATLIRSEQSEGDWSDAAMPALIIPMMMSEEVGTDVDFGAGRIRDPIRPGYFAVVAPHTPTDIVVHGRHQLQSTAIPYAPLLELAGPDAGLPVDGDFGVLQSRYTFNRTVLALLQRLWTIARDASPYRDLAADGVLLELAAALLALRDGKPPRSTTGLAAWRLRRATEALAESAPRKVLLAELAALVGLSAAHFARAFKASTGVTPPVWVMRHRMTEAEANLAFTSASIADIAAECGFASQQHFTTAFRRHTGVTPAAWRRERRS